MKLSSCSSSRCLEYILFIARDKVERNEMLKKMPSMFLLMDELCDSG